MNATAVLEEARQARRDGDISTCVERAYHAVSLADQDREPEAAYHACACVGRLYLSRDEAKDAYWWFRVALGQAQANGLTRWEANAHHDVYLAAREAGESHPRRTWGARAFAMYREVSHQHTGITGLLADFSAEMLDAAPTDADRISHAYQAWRAVPASMPQPRYHLAADANVMRASALMRNRKRYEDAAQALERTLESLPHHEHAARTLTDAARAATVAHDFPRAARLAERAVAISESRGEGRVCQRATEVLVSALAERVAVL